MRYLIAGAILLVAMPVVAQTDAPFFSTVSAQKAVAGSNLYQTAFPATENPISQSSKWTNGGTTGLDWSNCKTNGMMVYGAQTSFGANDNDSTCLETSVTWGSCQVVEGRVLTAYPAGPATEIELRTLSTIAAHSITGYEFNWSEPAGAYQIVRWNGALNSYTILDNVTGITTPVFNGDVIRATSCSGTHNMYKNGVLVASATDSTYTSGSPGVGFYTDSSGDLVTGGITNLTMTDGTFTMHEFTQPGADYCYHSITSGTSLGCTLPTAPPANSVVAVSIQTFPVRTISSVKDNAGTPNTYTPVGCSTTNESTAGNSCLDYFLPTSTGGATVTATINSSCTACSITVDVFPDVGGTPTYDSGVITGHGSGAVILPSIIPAQTGWPTTGGELVWGFCTNATACNAPSGSVWIQELASTSDTASVTTAFGENTEYQLTAPNGALLVGFAGTTSANYDSSVMAFKP